MEIEKSSLYFFIVVIFAFISMTKAYEGVKKGKINVNENLFNLSLWRRRKKIAQ